MTISVPENVKTSIRSGALGLLVAGGLAVAAAVGYFAPGSPLLALAAALAVLAVGVTVVEPAMLPVLALPGLLVTIRLTRGGTDVATSDVILAALVLPCLIFGTRPYSPVMRMTLWCQAAYLATSLFTVLANPFTANTVEFVHQVVLVMGALIVGWTVGRRGFARTGLGALLGMGVLIALGTIAQGVINLTHGVFDPVYPTWPFSMHKNFVGCILAFLAVVAYARPDWARLPRWVSTGSFWLYAAALIFSQSRQGIIGLACGLIILVARSRSAHRRSQLVLLAMMPALVFVTTLVKDQIKSGNQHNPVFSRVDWIQDAYHIWLTRPWVGVGNRWWYTDHFPNGFQPPNMVMEVLTTTGIVGLVGFTIMTAGAFLAVRRLPAPFAVVGMGVITARVVQSQFDLFWVFGASSLVWILVGITIGAAAHAEANAEPSPDLGPSATTVGEPVVAHAG